MSRQHHYLKTINPFFLDVEHGDKTFEVRYNDRNYQKDDILHLQEFVPPETFTGRVINAEVAYILNDPLFCKDGFVIMGLRGITYGAT